MVTWVTPTFSANSACVRPSRSRACRIVVPKSEVSSAMAPTVASGGGPGRTSAASPSRARLARPRRARSAPGRRGWRRCPADAPLDLPPPLVHPDELLADGRRDVPDAVPVVHGVHVLRCEREPLSPVQRPTLRQVEAVLERDGAVWQLLDRDSAPAQPVREPVDGRDAADG